MNSQDEWNRRNQKQIEKILLPYAHGVDVGMAELIDCEVTEQDNQAKELLRLRKIESDMKEAAGEMLIDIPEPGTDLHKMLMAVLILRRERDKLRKIEAAAKKFLKNFDAEDENAHDQDCNIVPYMEADYDEIEDSMCTCGLIELMKALEQK